MKVKFAPYVLVGWSDQARTRFHRPEIGHWSACYGTWLDTTMRYDEMPAEMKARLSPCLVCFEVEVVG